jgi:hypothetical protein
MDQGRTLQLGARGAAWIIASVAAQLTAVAQVSLADFSGDTAAARLGARVAGMGDLNGDGVLDLAAVSDAWGSTNYANYYRGRVTVFSGATRTVLRHHDGTTSSVNDCLCFGCICQQGELLGRSIDGLGDLNADGRSDYAIGAAYGDSSGNNNTGRVIVYSGGSGAVIRTHHGAGSGDAFGYSLAAAGDLDGDGAADYVIGAPNFDPSGLVNAGAVYAYSGAAGVLLWRTDGYRGQVGSIPNGDQFGYSVDALGDVTADGKSEIVVGAPNGTFPSTGTVSAINVGAWFVLDGATGVVLYSGYSTTTGDRLGEAVSGLSGDIDGDSVPDFAAWRNRSGGQRVSILSGLGGVAVGQILAPQQGSNFGLSITGFGDGDGDGQLDVAIGAPLFDGPTGADSGAVYVYTYGGAGMVQIAQLNGVHAGDRFGASVDGLAPGLDESYDWNGDGRDDVLIGAPHDSSNFGLASIYPIVCKDPESYCVTTPNSVGPGASMGFSGMPSVANTNFAVTVSNAPANKSGLFFYGQQQVQIPICGAMRCVGGSFLARLPVVVTTGAGTASHTLAFANPPFAAAQILPHSRWNFQFWYRDPQGPTPCGTNYSDALDVTFCP